jgi:hypothetical protein
MLTAKSNCICPHCLEIFWIDLETMPMDGIINCPYCRKEIKED